MNTAKLMKKRYLFYAIQMLASLTLFSLAELAAANCGPQNPSCADEQALHDLYGSPSSPQQPQVKWSTRWGAVTYDATGFGATTNMNSEQEAKKAAIAQCKAAGGGKQCDEVITYYNACFALSTNAESSGWASDSGLPQAEKKALAECSKTGEHCTIYYSACSLPVRVQ